MGDELVLGADEAIGREPEARPFGVWSEGYIVDDDGCIIHSYQVNVPGPDSESPVDGWPLSRPVSGEGLRAGAPDWHLRDAAPEQAYGVPGCW